MVIGTAGEVRAAVCSWRGFAAPDAVLVVVVAAAAVVGMANPAGQTGCWEQMSFDSGSCQTRRGSCSV